MLSVFLLFVSLCGFALSAVHALINPNLAGYMVACAGSICSMLAFCSAFICFAVRRAARSVEIAIDKATPRFGLTQ